MSPEIPELLSRISAAVGIQRVRTVDAQRVERNGARLENEQDVAEKLRRLADQLDRGNA